MQEEERRLQEEDSGQKRKVCRICRLQDMTYIEDKIKKILKKKYKKPKGMKEF